MNILIDLIIVLCVGWGAYRGFKKGFIIHSFGVFAVVLAIWGGFIFMGKVEDILNSLFKIDPIACAIISYIIVFLIILKIVYLIGFIVTKFANAATLGMINKLGGAAFGILLNILVLSIIILGINKINDKKEFIKPETLEKSYLYEPVGKFVYTILPESFLEKFTGKK